MANVHGPQFEQNVSHFIEELSEAIWHYMILFLNFIGIQAELPHPVYACVFHIALRF